ncbi:MAG: hypothetical protein OXE53_16725 [Deltaproteobacteria bacterium]|nr:hypothetical protein [Deltaproteobacteria bacterium]
MKLGIGDGLSLFMAGLFVCAILSAAEWPVHSRAFVLAMAVPGLALTVVLFVRQRWWQRTAAVDSSPGLGDTPMDADVPPAVARRRMINVFAWIFVLFGLIWLVGFEIAVPLFTFVYLRFQARESLLLSGSVAGVMVALIVGVFNLILHVLWPKGMLQGWLGL